MKGLNSRTLLSNSSNQIGGILDVTTDTIVVPVGATQTGIIQAIGTDFGRQTYANPLYGNLGNATVPPLLLNKIMAINTPYTASYPATIDRMSGDVGATGSFSVIWDLCSDLVGYGVAGNRFYHNYYFTPLGLGAVANNNTATISLYGLRMVDDVTGGSSVVSDLLGTLTTINGYATINFTSIRKYRMLRIDTQPGSGAITRWDVFGELTRAKLPLSI